MKKKWTLVWQSSRGRIYRRTCRIRDSESRDLEGKLEQAAARYEALAEAAHQTAANIRKTTGTLSDDNIKRLAALLADAKQRQERFNDALAFDSILQ